MCWDYYCTVFFRLILIHFNMTVMWCVCVCYVCRMFYRWIIIHVDLDSVNKYILIYNKYSTKLL